MSNVVGIESETQRTNYYEVLGVQESADAASIRTRYRSLALENHPDRFEAPGQKVVAAAQFKIIREAYEVLADAEQRRRYDTSRAAGRTFVPQKDVREGSDPTLADIFGDVDRFPFPAQTKQIADSRLRDLINKSIIQSETLKEKVIVVYKIASSDICEGTSPQVRGVTASAQYLVLTNFRVLVALDGHSSYKSGNTTYTTTYWAGVTSTLMNISRIDFSVAAQGDDRFEITLYGPDTVLVGGVFTLIGSVAPFLWLASLFSIEVGVTLKVPTDAGAYTTAARTSVVIGVVMTGLLSLFLGPASRGVGVFSALLVVPILVLAAFAYRRSLRQSAMARLFASFGA